MKATLTFNLPEEKPEFELAQNAGKYQSVLYELDQQYLRANIKYGMQEELRDLIIQRLHEGYTDSMPFSAELVTRVGTEVLEIVREELHRLLNEEGVDIL